MIPWTREREEESQRLRDSSLFLGAATTTAAAAAYQIKHPSGDNDVDMAEASRQSRSRGLRTSECRGIPAVWTMGATIPGRLRRN
jgi:hypothetical protein